MNARYPAQTVHWLKPLLLIILALAMLIIFALLIVELDLFHPADNTRATWLPDATDTRVSFTPAERERLYDTPQESSGTPSDE